MASDFSLFNTVLRCKNSAYNMNVVSSLTLSSIIAFTLYLDSVCLAAEKERSIKGLVLDPVGKPLAGVCIDAVILSRRPMDSPLAGSTIATVVGQCKSESDGSFALKTSPRSAESEIALEVFAYAEGYGVSFQYLEDASEEYTLTLNLMNEKIVIGTLTDCNHDALAHATLTLSSLRSREGIDNTFPFHDPPSGLSAWPDPIRTDAQGSFTIRGVSAETEIQLSIKDERAVRQRWDISVGSDAGQAIELKTESPRIVQGRVVEAGSHDPVEGAIVTIGFYGKQGEFLGREFVYSDNEGRFSLICFNGNQLEIRVTKPSTKYKALNRSIEWVDGTAIQSMTLPLDHDGFERLDGTTFDGQPASTIEAEVPLVEVTFERPQAPLTAELSGTIFVSGAINLEDSDTQVCGLFEIDVASGRWQTIALDVAHFRASPNGKYIAFETRAKQLRVVGTDSNASTIELSNGIMDGGFHLNCWTPDSTSLILSKHAPKRRHYYGEEYWQLDTDKWQFNIKTTQLQSLAVPPRHDIWDVSPDGQLIAMHWDTHAHTTGAQLYFASRDGSNVQPLARKREQYYWYPRFSPDGESVLAKYLNGKRGESIRGHDTSLRVISAKGLTERSIQVSDDYLPEIACWSPKGDYIAVIAFCNAAFSGSSKQSKIFVINADGNQITEVKLQNATELFLNQIDWVSVTFQAK